MCRRPSNSYGKKPVCQKNLGQTGCLDSHKHPLNTNQHPDKSVQTQLNMQNQISIQQTACLNTCLFDLSTILICLK